MDELLRLVNSPRALLDAALVRGGLSEMFPVKLAADEVAAPKHQDFPADVVIESLRDEDLLAWVRGWPRR
ncbi:hypothetical protein [Amycolatopsis sp. cmx-11-12]|uniref:hypothetical protein n=1 Tax=Amycolatopsis sp. cmx-11-12 TaxID=2785795 RepID=UPI003916F724